MKNKDVNNIDVWFIIELANAIYKLHDEQEVLLTNVPFLISVCDFGFKKGYLTKEQKSAISLIHNEYKIFKKYHSSKKAK